MSGKKLKALSKSTPTASKCYCGPQNNIRSPIPQRRYAVSLITPRPKATGMPSSVKCDSDAAYDQAFLHRGGPLAPAAGLVTKLIGVPDFFLLQREDRCVTSRPIGRN